MKVLLIDGEAIIVTYNELLLNDFFPDIETFSTTNDAIAKEKLHTEKFDLVIQDLNRKGISDGKDLADFIVSSKLNCPILFFSAMHLYVIFEVFPDFLDHNWFYLQKPSKPSSIIFQVSKILSLKPNINATKNHFQQARRF